ncbi:hypothetical protein BYT27DRAFT_7070270, partial [Phlegmacium glaucopus]
LTEKEMAELRAAGRCFNCGEEGHISQNCHHRAVVKGGTQKPPGIPNYRIDMNL